MPRNQTNHKQENKKQFDAFLIYRDMGATRSRRKVAAMIGSTPNTVAVWAKQYEWDKRLEDFTVEVARKREEGELIKSSDPTVIRMNTLIEQIETAIDSAFEKDDIGRRKFKLNISCVEDLTKLTAEYRKLLEAYATVVRGNAPKERGSKHETNIGTLNAFLGNSSQKDRIAFLQDLGKGDVNVDDTGGDQGAEGNCTDADYTDVSESGSED